MTEQTNDAVTLAAELTAAWLSNHNTRASGADVTAFLQSMHATVTGLSGTGEVTVEEAAPAEYVGAVSARKSLASPDHIVSMIDGKPYKTLRRHLATNGLTPEEYRARYGLKKDYPMVASSYSESRRDLAKRIGLGRKPGQTVEKTDDAAPAEKATKAAPRSRKAAQDAAKAHLGG
jgi:predicted transcriptional regulator